MEKPLINPANKVELPKAEQSEEIAKYFQDYFLREYDDWTEILSNKRRDGYDFQNILEERKKDNENIENYQNGQQIKLSVFNTYLKIVNHFIINRKRKDEIYEGPQVTRDWHIPKDPMYGNFTKESLFKLVNLRYDLLEKVLNSKIKPLLIGSEFKNLRGDLIKIKNVDFTSGEINFEHKKSENDKHNYYEIIKTSVSLQEHIASIVNMAKTKK